MQFAALLDTAVSSDNLGDEIIMDAVRDELSSFMTGTYFRTVATHDSLGRTARKILKASAFGIVGGTNFLSSNLLASSGWKITALDIGSLHDIVMMGIGWRDYQKEPTAYSRYVYSRVLSKRHIHSCRDEYSASRLRSLGLTVLNTSCPTVWKLVPEVCRRIPVAKAPVAITALTYYRPDPVNDRAMLELVCSRYQKVLFWPQQYEDIEYLNSLGDFAIDIIPPSIVQYNRTLDRTDVDFIGSRLHGGIRALQRGRRALILSIDNRAKEMGRDTHLPVVERSDMAAIAAWIDRPVATDIALPQQNIEAWKAQFV